MPRTELFKLEREMTRPALDWAHAQGMHTIREFIMNWGVCDIAACAFVSGAEEMRVDARQKAQVGGHFQRKVFLRLPTTEKNSKGMTFEDLCVDIARGKSRITFSDVEPYTVREIRRELDKLVSRRLVSEVAPGSYAQTCPWHPMADRVVGIELKLDRVSVVQSQASSNQVMFPQSYVGLPADVCNRVMAKTNGQVFRVNGTGLLAVSPDGCEELISPDPEKSRAPCPEMVMEVAERIWYRKRRGDPKVGSPLWIKNGQI